MNHMEEAILNRFLRLLDRKTSWGRNELKDLLIEITVAEISRLPPVRTPAPIQPKPKDPEDGLTPCPHISLNDLPSQMVKIRKR